MTKAQGWILIGFIAIVLIGCGIFLYQNSMQAKIDANIENSKADNRTPQQGVDSCLQMCVQNYQDSTQEETCARECAKAYNVPWN
jgi:hypothetical protein